MNYFIHADDEQKGPYTETQLKAMWLNGLLTASTLYWCEGMAEWRPVAELCDSQTQAPSPQTSVHVILHFVRSVFLRIDQFVSKIASVTKRPLPKPLIYITALLLVIFSIAGISECSDRAAYEAEHRYDPTPLRPEVHKTLHHIGNLPNGRYVIQELRPGDSRWRDIGTCDTHYQAQQILSASGAIEDE